MSEFIYLKSASINNAWKDIIDAWVVGKKQNEKVIWFNIYNDIDYSFDMHKYAEGKGIIVLIYKLSEQYAVMEYAGIIKESV